MQLTIKDLEQCFQDAKESRVPYVAVVIQMEGFELPEVIINPIDNFDRKLEYYKKAYNEDLTLKSFSGIKIIGFVGVQSFEEVEKMCMMCGYFTNN